MDGWVHVQPVVLGGVVANGERDAVRLCVSLFAICIDTVDIHGWTVSMDRAWMDGWMGARTRCDLARWRNYP